MLYSLCIVIHLLFPDPLYHIFVTNYIPFSCRICNLELLSTYGSQAWRMYNDVISAMLQEQQKTLLDIRYSTFNFSVLYATFCGIQSSVFSYFFPYYNCNYIHNFCAIRLLNYKADAVKICLPT